MRLLIGVGEIAGGLRFGNAFIEKGEGIDFLAVLHGEESIIHRSAVEAGGRSRFETAHRIAERDQIFRERGRAFKAVRTAVFDDFARDRARVEIDPRRNDDGAAGKNSAVGRSDARDLALFGDYFRRLALYDP